MRKDIILEDTTLRDGELASGIAFDKHAKIEIYKALVNAGVKWLEVGIPTMGGTELEAAKTIKDMSINDGIMAVSYNKGTLEDISFAISLGFKAVHFGLPTARKDKKFTPSWMISESKDLIKFAKDKGVFVSVSAIDAGRSDLTFLKEYAVILEEAGADRLRLSDTIGILRPQQYHDIVEAITKVSSIALQCHAHNDFGFALANTLSALEGGAKYFHVTVNGMGERAGMPDFAQVVIALKKFYDIDVGIKLENLTELANTVAKYSKVPICPWQPIVGPNVFTHEEFDVFEPFEPEWVGGKKHTILGKHSSKNTVKQKLEGLGIRLNEDLLPQFFLDVREKSMVNGGQVLDNELIEIYKFHSNEC